MSEDNLINDDNFKIGSFGHHEALDRTSLQINNWDDFIVKHRFIELHPDLLKQANEIENLMAELYQSIGSMK